MKRANKRFVKKIKRDRVGGIVITSLGSYYRLFTLTGRGVRGATVSTLKRKK